MLKERYLSSAEDFLSEAIINIIRAQENPSRWKFAAIHLVASLELAFKAKLYSLHPILLRDSFESTKRSVTLVQALARLKDPEIYGLRIPPKAEQSIASAVELRNGISHAVSFENERAISSRCFEVLAFMRFFLRTELGRDLKDFADPANLQELRKILNKREDFLKYAQNELGSNEDVFCCPDCFEDFFVKRKNEYICLHCLHNEPPSVCDDCQEELPSTRIFQVSEYFEYSFADGHTKLVNNFGIPDIEVCPHCLKKRREEIDRRKFEDSIEDFFF